MRTFSIVVPIYQNEANIDDTVPKLLGLRSSLPGYKLQIVFVDDGSSDNSFRMLQGHQKQHPEVIKLVRLSRNFGQTPAIQAGLRFSAGDCVGIISADLQEPYGLFPEMVERWEAGAKFVIAARKGREDGALHGFLGNQYWALIRRHMSKDFPTLGYDFCLIDRQLVEEINRINEKNTSIFVLLFWLGFRPEMLPIVRQRRLKGSSQWSLLRRVRITIDTLIGSTHVPVRTVTLASLAASVCALLFLTFTFARWAFLQQAPMGWMTIVALQLVLGALILFALGVIGEYLWRILDEVRNRPPFITDSVENNQ